MVLFVGLIIQRYKRGGVKEQGAEYYLDLLLPRTAQGIDWK